MKILGIGVDICEISRMKSKSVDCSFVRRFFSPEEQAYLKEKGKGFPQSLAGMYAAKEAFAKVLGSGVQGFELKEVEVLHTSQGQPFYRVSGKALAVMGDLGIEELHLSISHDGNMAVAFAVGAATSRPVDEGD